MNYRYGLKNDGNYLEGFEVQNLGVQQGFEQIAIDTHPGFSKDYTKRLLDTIQFPLEDRKRLHHIKIEDNLLNKNGKVKVETINNILKNLGQKELSAGSINIISERNGVIAKYIDGKELTFAVPVDEFKIILQYLFGDNWELRKSEKEEKKYIISRKRNDRLSIKNGIKEDFLVTSEDGKHIETFGFNIAILESLKMNENIEDIGRLIQEHSFSIKKE